MNADRYSVADLLKLFTSKKDDHIWVMCRWNGDEALPCFELCRIQEVKDWFHYKPANIKQGLITNHTTLNILRNPDVPYFAVLDTPENRKIFEGLWDEKDRDAADCSDDD
jgi:hypothetical protein